MRSPVCALATVALVAGCNPLGEQLAHQARAGQTHAALEAYRAHVRNRRASDGPVLADIALSVIARAAESNNARERAAGFSALRTLGARARSVYDELSRRAGVVGDRAAAEAYDLGSRAGSPPDRLTLAWATDDTERRVAGLAALEGRRDVDGLVGALDNVIAEIRRGAALRLGRIRGDARALHALSTHARSDPDAAIRALCVSALGAHGTAASTVLADALGDPDTIVRMNVVPAIMQADPDRARAVLQPLLAHEPTPLAIEAARVLAGRQNAEAAGFILAALEHANPAVRAQAAVAAISLAGSHEEALAPHIEDADVEVQIRVAGILVRQERFRSRIVRALRPIAQRPDPFVAVRALAVLVDAGDASATDTLRGGLRATDPTVRRLAVLSWSHLASRGVEVDPLAPLLEDTDRSVRLMAAAEIVRAHPREPGF